MGERTAKCPLCGKAAAWEENLFRPFCSERCRLLDLGKWASGEYRIPDGTRPPDGEEDAGDGGRREK